MINNEITIKSNNYRNDLKLLIENNPHSSAYHSLEWGETICTVYQIKKYYLTIEKMDEINGFFPIFHINSLFFGNRLISIPFCEYGGMLLNPILSEQYVNSVSRDLLRATTKLAKKLQVEYILIRNPLNNSVNNYLHEFGFIKYKKYVTFKIDLQKSIETLWDNLHKKTRNAVRKSIKSGIEIEEVVDVNKLVNYYRLYLLDQKQRGSPSHSFNFFKTLFETLFHKNGMRVLLAKYGNRNIAGVIFFRFNEVIYWWNGVVDREYRSLNPTNLLLWNTIKQESNKGYKILDLGRTRMNTGIYNFKKRWGGSQVSLLDYVYFLDLKRREHPDPSPMKYWYLSKIWSFLPLFITNKIGYKIIKNIAL